MNSLCVFCGSTPGKGDSYLEAARAVGRQLAARGITLVYGGGSLGLSGAVANATLRAGGRAVGVIPRHLWEREAGHRALSDLFIVNDVEERKAKMAELADGFIVLPGGLGTIEEFFGLWNRNPLASQAKPFGVLDIQGYWGGLFGFLDTMVAEGFLKPEQRSLVQLAADPERLLDRLSAIIGAMAEEERALMRRPV